MFRRRKSKTEPQKDLQPPVSTPVHTFSKVESSIEDDEFTLIELPDEVKQKVKEPENIQLPDQSLPGSPDLFEPEEPPGSRNADVASVIMTGSNPLKAEDLLTNRNPTLDSKANFLEDTLFLVENSGVNCHCSKLLTPDVVSVLGKSLSSPVSTCSKSLISKDAYSLIEYVRSNFCSRKIQQVFSLSETSALDQLLLSMCGPSEASLVHMRHVDKEGDVHHKVRSIREGLHFSLANAASVLQSKKVLVALNGSSSLRKKCFNNEAHMTEALKRFEDLALEEAKYVCDPIGVGEGSVLELQTVSIDKNDKESLDMFRRVVDSFCCYQYYKDNELTLLLHLKAYSILDKKPVITVQQFFSIASQFGLNEDQANATLSKFQKAWLLYKPNELLDKFIFLNFQWLLDAYNAVICPPQAAGSKLCVSWDRLRKQGKINQDLLDCFVTHTPQIPEVGLPKNWLIYLMKHLRLIAICNPGEYNYKAFSPIFLKRFVLKQKQNESDADIASAYFLPPNGCIPPPLYMSRLITYLSRKSALILESCPSQSCAVFSLKSHSNINVRISRRKGFIRVHFYRGIVGMIISMNMKEEIALVVKEIISEAHEVLVNIFTPAPYLHDSKYCSLDLKMYLTCTGCSLGSKHLALCDNYSSFLACMNTSVKKHQSSLPASQQFWMKETSALELSGNQALPKIKPMTYVSVDETSQDEDVVSQFWKNHSEQVLCLLDFEVVRQYLYQYGILGLEQTEMIRKKALQDENDSFTILTSSSKMYYHYSEDKGLIMDALMKAGARGIVGLVELLSNTSEENDNHLKVLRDIKLDSNYPQIYEDWLEYTQSITVMCDHFPISVTHNVYIRHYQLSDASSVFNAVDSNRAYLNHWFPWVAKTKAIEDSVSFIKWAKEQNSEGNGLHLGLFQSEQQEEEKYLGGIGFPELSALTLTACIGYWLIPEAQGQGIVTIGCQKLIEFARREVGVEHFEIHTMPDNVQSQAVAKRLNFKKSSRVIKSEETNDSHYVVFVYPH